MRYILALLAILLTCSAGARTVAHRRLHFRAQTVFLCHFDGADAATSATDVATGGNAPHVLTFSGNAQLDTDQKQFGTASAWFDGGGSIDVTSASDLCLPGTAWTIEFWIRFASLPSSGSSTMIMAKNASYASEQRSWALYVGNNYFGVNGLNLTMWSATTDVSPDYNNICNFNEGTYGLSTGTWYHFAIVRNGSTISIYRDGTLSNSVGSITDTARDGTATMYLGGGYLGAVYNGWIDELRISTTARYTSNFTPSGPFTP